MSSPSHARRRTSALRACRLALLCCCLATSTLLLGGASATSSADATLVANYGDSAAALMEAAEAAYSLVNSSFSIYNFHELMPGMVENLWVEPASVDFIVTGQRASDVYYESVAEETAANTDITSLPIGGTAVVPVYNLPGRTTPILLTRATIALIFLGNITRWNDARLAELNDDLPDHVITMVLSQTRSSQNLGFTRAMAAFNSNWTTIVGDISDLVAWPLANYESYKIVNASSSLLSYIASTEYTLGYANMALAIELDESMRARMVNKAGQVVAASADSVTYAMVELGAYVVNPDGDNDLSWTSDLTDGSGYQVWPMTYMLVAYLPKTYTRTTCSAREALVDFFLWMFASTVVSAVAEELGVAMLPANTYTAIGLDTLLRTEITCNGTAVSTEDQYTILVAGEQLASLYSSLVTRLLSYYSATVAEYIFTYTVESQLTAIEQLEARTIDSAVIEPDQFRVMYPGVMESLAYSVDDASAGIATGDLISMPYSLYAIVPIFNLPDDVATAYASGLPLIIDMSTLARIFIANITSWTDSAIEALNPGLSAAFTSTGSSTNITLVLCSGSENLTVPITNALATALYLASADFAAFTTWSMPIDWSATIAASTATYGSSYLLVDEEVQMESAVSKTSGSIGYKLAYNNTADTSSLFSIRRTTVAGTLRPPNETNEADAITTTLNATTDVLTPCANAVTASLDFAYTVSNVIPTSDTLETLSQCWPITLMTALVVPATFTDDDSDSCARANQTLNMALWFVNDTAIEAASNTRAVIRLANSGNAMSVLQIAALQSATCDGKTILVTLNSVWTLSSYITTMGWVLCGIGLAAVAASAVVLVKYRHRSVLRSSSVPFQFVILAGLAVLFVSVAIFGMKPSDAQCQSLAWLLNIGFTLTFGPLFAKMWRIYKIFDRRVLRVVKISNEKLGMMVAGLVLVDVALNLAWQFVSPVYSGAQLHTTNGVTWSYDHCTGDNGSLPFLAVLGGLKVLMLVFGSFIGFTTRNVSSTFNESKNVAWAIYNVFLTAGIIVPVIIFSSVRGDSFTLLVVFLIWWIAACTCGFNFGSKFLVLFRHEDDGGAGGRYSKSHGGGGERRDRGEGDVVEGVGSSDLFSFPPPTSVPKAQLDRFIAALEAQITTAKVRHHALVDGAMLTGSGGGGGGGGGGFGRLSSSGAPRSQKKYRVDSAAWSPQGPQPARTPELPPNDRNLRSHPSASNLSLGEAWAPVQDPNGAAAATTALVRPAAHNHKASSSM